MANFKKHLVCRGCGLNTMTANMIDATKFHRKYASSHAPDLVTIEEWERLNKRK